MKKVLITGATSGIGEALAYAFHKRGTSLLLTGRNEEKLKQLQEELGAKTLVQDLAQNRLPLIQWLLAEKPDYVVNNAGFGLYGEIASQKTEALLELFRVDGEAVTEISIEAVQMWKKNQIAGTLINISSAAAFLPLPHMAIYAATKAYVNSFSLALGQEVAKEGIRVLVCCPGMVDTPFSERASGKKRRTPSFLTISREKVVESIFHQMQKGTPLVVIDGRYRLLLFLARFFSPGSIGFMMKKFGL